VTLSEETEAQQGFVLCCLCYMDRVGRTEMCA
jgi:hypothetical protein